MGGSRSFAAGHFGFAIDGETAGFIKSVTGATTKMELATHNISTSIYQKKHGATIVHDDATIEISGGMGKPMWEWIKASFDHGFVQKNCELQACDFNYEVKSVRVLQDAYIGEVSIPTLKGDDKNPLYFTVKFVPTTIRYEKGSGKLQGDENLNSKKWLCSNFRVEIDGLPCERVHSFEGAKWTQKTVKDEVGLFREPRKEPASLEVANIKLQILDGRHRALGPVAQELRHRRQVR